LRYSQIADTYEKIESTSKRLEMTEHLVNLIRNTPKEMLGKVAYLTQGKLYPDFLGIETGIAEKSAISAIAKASGLKKEEVTREWKRLGDLGLTAEELLSKTAAGHARLVSAQPLTVERVYDVLDRIAKTSGEGAVESRLNLLSEILTQASPK